MSKYILPSVCLLLILSQCSPLTKKHVEPSPTSYTKGDAPPSEPGKCYAKVIAPAQNDEALVEPAEKELVWAEVICERHVSNAFYKKLINALLKNGYDADKTTMKSALLAFQNDNNLAQGAFTIETLRALGIRP